MTYPENSSLSLLSPFRSGVAAEALRNIGQGLDPEQPLEKDRMMVYYRDVTPSAYEDYTNELKHSGWNALFENELEGNRCAQFEKDGQRIYLHFTLSSGILRIMDDTASTLSVPAFSCPCEKQPGESTQLYQIGLPISEEGTNIRYNLKKIDCGMMFVFGLADHSLLLIDGGACQQFDDAQIAETMRLFEALSGCKNGEPIHIACWYITHAHSDHFAGIGRLFNLYHERFVLERVMWNFPSINCDDTFANVTEQLKDLLVHLRGWFGEAIPYLKPHAGQKLMIRDVEIQVLYTHENLLDPWSDYVEGDYNNASTVSVFRFDGKRFMLPGDINGHAQDTILEAYTDKTLQCDILQLEHHGINNVSLLNAQVRAPWVFIPQSPMGTVVSPGREENMETVRRFAAPEQIFFASEETTGVEVKDGKLQVIYHSPVAGGNYGGWTW